MSQKPADKDASRNHYTCDICGQDGLGKVEMEIHMDTAHGEELVCLFCDLKGVTADEMALHINSVHLGDNNVDTNDRKCISEEQNFKNHCPEKGRNSILRDSQVDFGLGEQETEFKRVGIAGEDKVKISNGPALIPNNFQRINEAVHCPDDLLPSNSSQIKVAGMTNDLLPSNSSQIKVADMTDYMTDDFHVDATDAPNLTRNNNIETDEWQLSFAEDQTDASLWAEIESHLCPFCDYVSGDADAYERHLIAEHSEFPDDECGWEELLKVDNGDKKETLLCPVCELVFLRAEPLQVHVNEHFNEEPQRNAKTSKKAKIELKDEELQKHKREAIEPHQKSFKSPAKPVGSEQKPGSERKIAEGSNPLVTARQPSSVDIDNMSSSTEGVIEKILLRYENDICAKNILLCSPVEHFATKFDRGWGCGYRNLQMILSCLAKCPTYRNDLFQGICHIPSVNKLQRLLENAWRRGFDEAGSRHFDREVVNTKKWIGATDVVALLSSLKVRCNLVDFHAPSGPNRTHPRLFQWVKRYFEKMEPFKPPLYFQHQGHSRTIIGVEEHYDGSLRLLVFDPGMTAKQMRDALQMPRTTWLINILRKSLKDLNHLQYQIVEVCGMMDDAETEKSKLIKSERVP